MESNRYRDFDLLRAVIIFNALLLHYNSNIGIGLLAKPSLILQFNIFTVGGFFFFTAGYMARKIYLKRFLDHPEKISKSVFIKGANILILHLVYVLFMHIVTETKLPNSLLSFIFDHQFYTVVLLTFSVLFMLTPLFLLVHSKTPGLSFVLTVLLALLVAGYDQKWTIPHALKIIFFDRDLFLYPLFPALLIYAGGFVVAGAESRLSSGATSTGKVALVMIVVFVHLLLINKNELYAQFITDKNNFTILEIITPYFSVLIARYLIHIGHIKKIVLSPHVLCIGVFSLHFYFISNLLLGLLNITKNSASVTKAAGFVGIASLSYLFTFWRNASKAIPVPGVRSPARI